MALRDLTDKAKRRFEERGGTERLKQDREALKEIARGEGSLSEKARAGLARLREEPVSAGRQPGGPEETGAEGPAPPAATEPHPAPGAPPAPSDAEPPATTPRRP